MNRTFKGFYGLFIAGVLSLALMAGCGEPGGGDNVSTTQTQTNTSTVGSGGGSLSPTNEITVSFDAGVVQDGTSVKVTLSDAASSTSTQIQPVSQVLQIEISPDAISQAITDETKGIYVQIPLDQSVAPSASPRRAGAEDANVYSYIMATAVGGPTFYGSYATQYIGEKAFAVAKLGAKQLSAMAKNAKEKADNVIIEFKVEHLNPNVPTAGQIFEVKGTDNFSTPSGSIEAGKLPLVLIHGIQVGCDGNTKAYKETWVSFINFFYGNKALYDKFQLYTYSYRTDTSIKLNGSLFAQALQSTFGNKPVVVIAHSMGGLVTRSAILHDNANIGGVITLGTPHHGTFITNDFAGLIDKTCFEATSSKGAEDLKWDNFDKPDVGCGNPFLCDPSIGLNNHDTNFQKYISYAGVAPYSTVEGAFCPEADPSSIWYWFCQLGVEAHGIRGNGYKSDGAVPEVSARFQDYINGQYQDKTTFKRTPRSYENKDHVSIHDDQATVLQDIIYDLTGPQGFYYSIIETISSDTTPPTVSSTSPANNATAIAVNVPITATFSEAMDSSTISTATFMLSNGSSNVAGTVTYSGTTATFTPYSNLAYSTTYTATITTGVRDSSGNAMANNYSWTFTTEAGGGGSVSPPPPPTSVSAQAGNGQITISWNSISGQSYNIYWSTSSGVSKTYYTGKISNVTSLYIHTGRTNGTTYYYVVTAVNSYGESGESSQVSATPQAVSTANPAIAQTPESASQGQQYSQWGTGFSQNSTAMLYFKDPSGYQTTKSQTMNSTGDFSNTYTMPSNQTTGTYSWWAVDGPTGKQSNTVTYTVVASTEVTPTIAQTPESVSQGQQYSQWGTGFSKNSTATLYFKDPYGVQTTKSQSINSTGDFSNTYTMSSSQTTDTYSWWAVDGPTGKQSNTVTYTVVASTAVNPTIAQTPEQVSQGQQYSQWGTGFSKSSTATLYFKDPYNVQTTKSQSITSTGDFSNTYTMSSSQTTGTYSWWAVDGPTGKQSNTVTYTVTASTTVNPISYEFNANGNLEGWTATNMNSTSVNGGIFYLDPAGADPYIYSPTISADASAYRYVEFKMANNALDGGGTIYFKTQADNTYTESKKVSFFVNFCSLCGNASYYTYTVDMKTNSYWTGTITGIRIDPAYNGQSGTSMDTIGIDYVRLTP